MVTEVRRFLPPYTTNIAVGYNYVHEAISSTNSVSAIASLAALALMPVSPRDLLLVRGQRLHRALAPLQVPGRRSHLGARATSFPSHAQPRPPPRYGTSNITPDPRPSTPASRGFLLNELYKRFEPEQQLDSDIYHLQEEAYPSTHPPQQLASPDIPDYVRTSVRSANVYASSSPHVNPLVDVLIVERTDDGGIVPELHAIRAATQIWNNQHNSYPAPLGGSLLDELYERDILEQQLGSEVHHL
ncbi:hypothetical protein EIP86_003011 [Pleurotus ostreatoroseus]|nr:hypothetical protein EIP86_003011 [Pleurotus ostreatoroseus]